MACRMRQHLNRQHPKRHQCGGCAGRLHFQAQSTHRGGSNRATAVSKIFRLPDRPPCLPCREEGTIKPDHRSSRPRERQYSGRRYSSGLADQRRLARPDELRLAGSWATSPVHRGLVRASDQAWGAVTGQRIRASRGTTRRARSKNSFGTGRDRSSGIGMVPKRNR
jgi:hypothetical protein